MNSSTSNRRATNTGSRTEEISLDTTGDSKRPVGSIAHDDAHRPNGMTAAILTLTILITLATAAAVVIIALVYAKTVNIENALNITSAYALIQGLPLDTDDTFDELNGMILSLMGIDNTPINATQGNGSRKNVRKATAQRIFSSNTRVFGEQLGPTRTSRCAAMYHWAVYEAMIASTPRRSEYRTLLLNPLQLSLLHADEHAAMIEAGRAVACHCYTSMCSDINETAIEMLARVQDGTRKALGVEIGRDVARAVIDQRANDGSQTPDPSFGAGYDEISSCASRPGCWSADPVSGVQLALGAYWGDVTPFVITSAANHLAPPPPPLSSEEYASAFQEVKSIGKVTSESRSAWETFIGVFYGYDGTPRNCAPPLLYNQLTMAVAKRAGIVGADLVKLMAVVNLGLADTVIAAWKTKYQYEFWRPTTAIRHADIDGNPATLIDENWTPLGVPLSNTLSRLHGVSPAFPEYVSGHSSMGGFIAHLLRGVIGRDDIDFEFISNEYDGLTRNSDGQPRDRVVHKLNSLYQMEYENGRSRVFIGVHFRFAEQKGIELGRSVATEVLEKMYGFEAAADAAAALQDAEDVRP